MGRSTWASLSIPDERLAPVAAIESSAKTTPATIRVVDPPGLSPAVLGELRKSDALIAVLGEFGPDSDPERDLKTIWSSSSSSPTETTSTSGSSAFARKRNRVTLRYARRSDQLERMLAHVEAGQSAQLLPGRRSRGDLEPLTTKPLIHRRKRGRRL